MSELDGTFRPHGVLISYVLRDAVPRRPANYDGAFEIYVGEPKFTVGSQATEELAIELPQEWRAHVAGVFKLRSLKSQQLRQYRSERYAIKFAQKDFRKLLELVLSDQVEDLVSLIRAGDPPMTGENLRPDQSGGSRGWDAAILTLFDLPSDAEPVNPAAPALDHRADAVSDFKSVLGQDTEYFSVEPTIRFKNLVFTKGGTRGSLLDSAAVLRLNGPPARPAFSLPYEAMDWVDIADITYIVGDLSDRLANEPLVKDWEEYLQPLASADVDKLYDRFIPTWSRALSTHINCREIRSEINSLIRGNAFEAGAAAGQTGVEFHRQVAAKLHSKMTDYEANESRLINRAQVVSSFLRDAVAWQSAQTHIGLAQAQNALTQTNNRLTTAGNDIAQSTREAAGMIKVATQSTDKLTVKVVSLTKIVIFLTVPIVVLTLIGAVGTWVPEQTRVEVLDSFTKVGKDILEYFHHANTPTDKAAEPDGG